MASRGTGLSIISNDDTKSYNSKVFVINKLQQRNARIMDNAVNSLTKDNAILIASILTLAKEVNSLKKQVFGNDVMIVNWNKEPPYSFDTTILA